MQQKVKYGDTILCIVFTRDGENRPVSMAGFLYNLKNRFTVSGTFSEGNIFLTDSIKNKKPAHPAGGDMALMLVLA